MALHVVLALLVILLGFGAGVLIGRLTSTGRGPGASYAPAPLLAVRAARGS